MKKLMFERRDASSYRVTLWNGEIYLTDDSVNADAFEFLKGFLSADVEIVDASDCTHEDREAGQHPYRGWHLLVCKNCHKSWEISERRFADAVFEKVKR